MQIVLGRYEVRATISKGPISTVYDGWDTVIDRRVAIKAVPLAQTNKADGWQRLTRFRRKAQAAGRLQHPAVVVIFDYGETAESAFIVMEFVEGGSLKAALEAGTRFSIGEVNRLMQDILAGLQYSHDRGIIHRDIKPANVMLTGDGHAKIADFSIARVEHSDTTQVGVIMGTPAYMSPEQFNGEAISPSTDIYSAGVILYQLLTSKRPFDGGLATITHKALSTEPPKPSDISRTAPRSVDGVVARAMAKQPDRRFNDAKGFAQALDEALAIKQADPAIRSIAAQKVPGPSRRATTPSFLYPVAGMLLLMLAVGGYWLLTPSAASKTEAGRGPMRPSQTAAAPAASSPPKEASQANTATPPATPSPASLDPLPQPTPMNAPSEPPPAPREALSTPPLPTAAPSHPMPDLSDREPAPLIHPLPQPAPPSDTSNTPTDAGRPPRPSVKDAHNPISHSPNKLAAGPRSDLSSVSKPLPWANLLDDMRAGRRPKDAPDDADAAGPTASDTPAMGPRRTPAPVNKATLPNSPAATDEAGQRAPGPVTSGPAHAAALERDSSTPAAPLDIATPPKFIGRMDMVNGRLTFVPAAPDPAK